MSDFRLRGLPAERPLRIFVNDTELVTLMATPDRLEELICGWLWSNGLISAASEILKQLIDVDRAIVWAEIKGDVPDATTRTIGSGCGGGQLIADLSQELPKVGDDLRLSMARLLELQTGFLRDARLYKETGGVHGAAVANRDKVLFIAEDIGRHNAVDKVIGWSLLNSVDLQDKLILTTGRISSEMLFKAARAGLQIVGSRTAATDLAVKMAQESGVTVVGYLRGGQGIVYSHAVRLQD